MAKKIKILDILLSRGIFDDKKTAEAFILEGRVKIDGKIIDQPGKEIKTGSDIKISKDKKYVSRGGYKLEGAVEQFGLKVKGKEAIDVGASTGGFTDFLLKSGAKRVIAVDVAYGKIDWKLRNDPRVIIYERENFRNMDLEKLQFLADIIVVDVSFISILKIIENILLASKDRSDILLLFKPQFEAKKEEVGKGGIVKDSMIHKGLLKEFIEKITSYPEITLKGISFSPITGTKGNIEYWIYLKKSAKENKSNKKYDKIIHEMVDKAHTVLAKGPK